MRSAANARWRRERNRRYRVELEEYLRGRLTGGYAERAAQAWQRDYADLDSYFRSVAANRRRWAELVGPPALVPAGPVEAEPYPLGDGTFRGFWVRLPLEEGLVAEAVLAVPDTAWDGDRVPLVVFQHGLGSCPETAFGVADESGAYHECGVELVRRGIAVLAPFNIAGVRERNRLQRLAWLGGGLVEGIELARLRCLLDVVDGIAPVDRDRIGVWGQSWGGLSVQYWMPLEQRLRVGVVSSYFNDRLPKMVVPDPRYTCFLETAEVHAHHPGLLREFADADLVSLICPRPLLVQHGRADDIGWAPAVAAEFERARAHWDRLGFGDRVALELHHGGHEVRPLGAAAWLEQWL